MAYNKNKLIFIIMTMKAIKICQYLSEWRQKLGGINDEMKIKIKLPTKQKHLSELWHDYSELQEKLQKGRFWQGTIQQTQQMHSGGPFSS